MSNREQVSPEDLLARVNENKLICEKLLGWHKCLPGSKGARNGYDWVENEDTPDFSSWCQAGLILDALSSRGVDPTLEYSDGKWDCYGGDPFESFIHAYRDTGPLAIRAAALEYIRRQS